MAGIVKCMGVMSGIGLLGGAGASYLMHSRGDKVFLNEVSKHAKDGKIPIGGRTEDGKMWDGAMSVEDFKKNLNKKTMIASAITGAIAAIGTAIVSGLTLLVKSKL
jgi:hypothetical protein